MDTVAIPVTRWKRGVKGIKPVTASIMRPVSSERKPDNSRIGRLTPCFYSESSALPAGKVSGNVAAWLQHIESSIKANAGIVPLKAVCSTWNNSNGE
jgi:hypothetical protein